MEYYRHELLVLLSFVVFINADPLVPALCIFGDSVTDAGNNNHVDTLFRANFLPYGRDFKNHKPTGRFCNGKLATDYIAEFLGFESYPPPYLGTTNKTVLLAGANFASAGSGYADETARLYKAISLRRQVKYYQDWQNGVINMVGDERANAIFSGGIHILSTGSSDFLQNYYISPVLKKLYTPSKIADILMTSYHTFIENLYGLGVRKIGVTTLPPAGCLPGAITLFGSQNNECVHRINRDAMMFNDRLNATSQDLVALYPDLKLVVFDIYHPLLALITKPADNGFFESRRGCCGTGIVETSLFCNKRSIGTCANASGYVFWDGFHPSEAANQILAQNLLEQGLGLVS
ncbi:hypothetical protein SSX86_026088 [Deinandra increscens subsp. villosa]|uniref:GDSL esterase/lipase n=1 Tax=Deinandra increscens subsp. villosa TaxID=3103831 RepID=A0AAP0CDU9_9ASTR